MESAVCHCVPPFWNGSAFKEMDVCRGVLEVSLGCHSQEQCSLTFEPGSVTGIWVPSVPQRCACLWLPTGCHYQAFYVGAGSHSGSYVWVFIAFTDWAISPASNCLSLTRCACFVCVWMPFTQYLCYALDVYLRLCVGLLTSCLVTCAQVTLCES